MSLLDRFKKSEKKETASIPKKKTILGAEKSGKGENLKKEAGKKIEKAERSRTPKERIISAYRVIKEPHITEKASYLGEQNKYIFKIEPRANKSEVKKAVETLYNTKVMKVNIICSAPKKRRVGKNEGWRGGLKKGFKKAIVTLKKGEKIEIIG